MIRLYSSILGLLWVILATQFAHILFLSLGPQYLAPQPVIHWIEKWLASKNLRCEFTSLWIDAHGGISCENLSIFKLDVLEPIAGAQKFYISPHWLQLFFGQWKPKVLQIHNGFIAPQLYPKPFLKQINFQGRGFAWGWNIDVLNAHMGDHRIHIQGQLMSLLQNNQAPFEVSSSILKDFINALQEPLDGLKNGQLLLRCHRAKIGQTSIDLYGSANSFTSNAFTLANIFTQGQFLIGPAGLKPQASFYAQGEDLSYENTCYAPFGQALLVFDTPPNTPFIPVLKNAQCFALGLKNIPFPIDCAWMKITPDVDPMTQAQLLLEYQDSWAAIEAPFYNLLKLKDKALPPVGDLPPMRASISSETFRQIGPLISILQNVTISSTVRLNGFRTYCQELPSYKVHFQTGPAEWKTIKLDSSSGIFSYNSNAWGLDAFEAQHKTGKVRGSIAVQPKNRYALKLQGSIDPAVLTPYLPKWWEAIWKPLRFSSQFPSTDLRIIYEDTDPVYFSVHGSVAGAKLSYYETPFDAFEAKIKAFSQCIDLGPFKATVGLKEGSGTISWLLNPQSSKTIFEFKSNLPISSYGIFAGAKPIIEIFDPKNAPNIIALGELPKGALYPSKLSLELDSPQQITLKGIRFDHLHFHCEHASHKMTLDPLQIGLGKGKLDGGLAVTLMENSSQNHQFEFEFNVNDVQLEELKKSFALLNKLEIQPTTTRTAFQNTEGPFGLIDGFFKGDGVLSTPITLNAAGFLHLQASRQPNTFLGLKFHTNNFQKPLEANNTKDLFVQELYAPIAIGNNILSIKEGWIRGPTSRIIMNGSCNLINEEIDFTFAMQPFREVPLLAAAFFPLRPITQALKMRFIGTLSNPQAAK